MAYLIDGQAIAERIQLRAREGAVELKRQGREVLLASIVVGNPAAGSLYTDKQQRRCDDIGIGFRLVRLERNVTAETLRECIAGLNADPTVTGIMLNMPLPESLNPAEMQYCIDPYKDVEGVNPANIGLLFYGRPIIAPCTALAVMEILNSIGVSFRGMRAAVVGQGAIVGRPITLFLLEELVTVTGCHIGTQDLAAHTREADLLIVAAGKAGLIERRHIKPGAIVIDVGINRVPDPRAPGKTMTVGDVDFESAKDVAGYITPVPGGVGPVTVAILMLSCVQAATKQLARRMEGA